MKLNIKYTKSRKNRTTKKSTKKSTKRSNKKSRRTRTKRRGGMIRRFAKNIGKTALDVTTDVVTEVSKDQAKQLAKKTVTSIGKASANNTFSPNTYLKKSDSIFTPSFRSSVPNTFEENDNYHVDYNEDLEPVTPTSKKREFEEESVYAPVKEKYTPEGSVFMHTSDISQVKKQLF